MISSPPTKLWSVLNTIWSVTVLIPPPAVWFLASKNTFLNLSAVFASNTAPVPLPPVIPIETMFWISKSWGSIYTFSKDPLITGWIIAVVPVLVGLVAVITGKLMTSYPLPPFRRFTFSTGPKYILSSDL